MLVEQALALRGKPMPDWTARGATLRKGLSGEYYDRGIQAYRTDVPGAIKLWETSLRYDPQNRATQAKLAKRAPPSTAEAHRSRKEGALTRSEVAVPSTMLRDSSSDVSRLAELLAHLLLELDGPLALELRLLIGRVELEQLVPLGNREVQVLPLECLRRLAIVAADKRGLRGVALQGGIAIAGRVRGGVAERDVGTAMVAARLHAAPLVEHRGEIVAGAGAGGRRFGHGWRRGRRGRGLDSLRRRGTRWRDSGLPARDT